MRFPIWRECYRCFEKKDWNVESQIGVSGFKIDIEIKHPNFPGKFLAVIECDRYTYHSWKSTRDRDKLR